MLERHELDGIVDGLEARARWRAFHVAATVLVAAAVLALAVGVAVAVVMR